jgi:RNA polymerase sigma factor (sigma-70 family)
MTVTQATVGVGDVGALYGALARPLERRVRGDVRAPDAVIEDACQFAWSRLLVYSARVSPEAVLSWLATTAAREARRMIRRAGREQSLEQNLDRGDWPAPAAARPGPEELSEQHERLRTLARLPPRQQRMLWLRGVGLSYAEIALSTGCTTRTVERQLLRARHALKAE